MQLKRQSVDVWQNEKHYSKGNNTIENFLFVTFTLTDKHGTKNLGSPRQSAKFHRIASGHLTNYFKAYGGRPRNLG